MAVSLTLIGSILELLLFSALMYTVLLSKSISVHFSRSISPILAPVSLSSCKGVVVFGVPEHIKESSSFSVGINGNLCSLAYFGGCHVLCKKLR